MDINDRSILSINVLPRTISVRASSQSSVLYQVYDQVDRGNFSRRDSRAISLIVSGIAVSNAGAGGIPVGIAVARQRLQHQETSTSMRNVSLSHHTSHHATSYHHFQPDSLGKFFSWEISRIMKLYSWTR